MVLSSSTSTTTNPPQLKNDPTSTRLKSLQNYLRKLVNRNELSPQDYNTIRPQNAKAARAHGLPKIHKKFDKLPKFRPIIDTTGSSHYNLGKYLTRLLNLLTLNDFMLKDSFDAANRIRNISPDLFDEGYTWVSLDVESLFTNVSLSRTMDVILKRVYKLKTTSTTLKKNTLKKLVHDTAQRLPLQRMTRSTNRWTMQYGFSPRSCISKHHHD